MSNTVTKKMILSGLKRLGLSTGDTVIVHSALSSFTAVRGGADTVINALLETVGPAGTVMMPAFGSPDAVFDPARSPTSLGVIAQTFWQKPGVLRSRHPLASAAAIGPNAKILLDNHENAPTAHGQGTPYHTLARLDGKILLLGVDQDRNTFLHTIEELTQAPYLKAASAKYVNNRNKTVSRTWPYFPGPHRDFISLQAHLRSLGPVSEVRIGTCKARLMNAAAVLDELSKQIASRPDLFISANPNLPDGISQRAQITRSKLLGAGFTLAADSQFAGTYIEEIIENLAFAGIDSLVLSTVNNIPWHMVPLQKRGWYLDGLKNAGIEIAAIRLPVTGTIDLRDLMAQAKTDAVILPGTADFSAIKTMPASKNVYVENVGISGSEMITMLTQLRKQHAKTVAAFNPLNFVQAGQNPFLTTYTKTSIKNAIGVLFINDGLMTGQRTPLEEGLAEIKELISILLCRSFSGLFILQGPSPSDFRQTASKFIQIYEQVR